MSVCKFEKCVNPPVFGSEYCWDHIEDKESYKRNLLSKAAANESLRNINLSKVDLRDAELARIDLSGANLTRADLSNSNLFDTNLNKAELLGSNLFQADLTSANLTGSDLTRSCLRNARLWHANLENATLIEADLDQCDLWNARLFNARFWRTNFNGAFSLSKKNFECRVNRFVNIYRINENGILSAEESYRDLKKYFLANGRYNDASWASFKEKTMEKMLLKKKKDPACIPSMIMDLLCGYGEKPHRIIMSSFIMILFYALLYFISNAITYAQSDVYEMSLGDYIYYSIITFTTVGYGDFIPKSALLFRSLAASEAFIGTFMIGLFIFTLARKYSAR